MAVLCMKGEIILPVVEQHRGSFETEELRFNSSSVRSHKQLQATDDCSHNYCYSTFNSQSRIPLLNPILRNVNATATATPSTPALTQLLSGQSLHLRMNRSLCMHSPSIAAHSVTSPVFGGTADII